MTVGVVLAGGSSSRMGRPKATLPFEGRTFVDRVATALGAVCERVIVVGTHAPVPWESMADAGDAKRGPLSGIVTALRSTGSDILVTAVDHPLIEAATLRRLQALGDDHPVLPVDGDVPQVTCAWYPQSSLRMLDAELDRGGFIRRALDPMELRLVHPEEWRAWGETGESWRSVDTPEEYESLATDRDRSPLTAQA